MKRSPLKRKTPLRRGVFKRKPTRDPITPETRAFVIARAPGGLCEARCHDGYCDPETGRIYNATHMHHIRRRRHGDHSAANLLHVCAWCHQWIHEHVAEAKQKGWLA